MPSKHPHQAGSPPAQLAPLSPAFLPTAHGAGVPGLPSSKLSSDAEWLEVEVALLDDQATVVLSGELDLATAPLLRRHLDAVVALANHVVVDLADVDFVGCAGLAVLLDAARRLDERGGTLRLRSARRIIEMTIAILGLDDMLSMAA